MHLWHYLLKLYVHWRGCCLSTDDDPRCKLFEQIRLEYLVAEQQVVGLTELEKGAVLEEYTPKSLEQAEEAMSGNGSLLYR